MIKQLEAEELVEKFKSGKFRLIDVREFDEFQGGHILNSESIPLSSFKENYSIALKDLNEEIVLTCRSGHRSMLAAKFLESRGFKNLANHEGGILGWVFNKLPISENGRVLPSSLRQTPDLE